MITVLLTLLTFQPATTGTVACAQAISGGSEALFELCLGDSERILGDGEKQPSEKSRHWRLAQSHYRRSASVATSLELKKRALNALSELFGPKRLDDVPESESVIRELIALDPNDLDQIFRLSRLLEDRLLLDAAEELLLAAHHQAPFAVEPYQQLAQFFARRATVMHELVEAQKATNGPTVQGEPDDQGIYRVGGAIPSPHKVDNPIYPAEALAAGIDGVVIAEIVLDASGQVTNAKIVRSIPLLDEAALQAVRNWRYEPTLVNGQAVPVRMTVTVNFTKPAK